MVTDSDRTFKTFFHKLFAFGTKRTLSHSDYKDLLDNLLDGKAHEEYLNMRERPLDKIVKYFICTYDKKENDPADIFSKIDTFIRNKNEPIDNCMTRLESHLYSASKMLSKTDRQSFIDTGIREKITKLVGPATKAKIFQYMRQSLKTGYIPTAEDTIKIAREAELEFNEVPDTSITLVEGPHPNALALHNLQQQYTAPF